MRNMIRTKVIAVGCLLFGLTVAMAGGQVVEDARFMNTGLFYLNPGAEANLYVSIDDDPGGPPARVLLQAFDENGSSVVRREVIIGAGQSATLRVVGPGHFRGHTKITELSSLSLRDRRAAVASAEINDNGKIRHVCFVPVSHDWEPLK